MREKDAINFKRITYLNIDHTLHAFTLFNGERKMKKWNQKDFLEIG